MTTTFDLAINNARIIDGTVDMGCYEREKDAATRVMVQ